MLLPLWRVYDEAQGHHGREFNETHGTDAPRRDGSFTPRNLNPAAQRALAEAQERRRLAAEAADDRPPEVGGRKGPDPVRYGDWEVKGIASDF